MRVVLDTNILVSALVLPSGSARRLDPTPLLSHTLPLEEAPKAYRMMAERLDGAVKIVLKARSPVTGCTY